MNEKVEISISPVDKYDLLALIYMKCQNLSEKTPEEALHIFEDAKMRMINEARKKSKKD